VASVITVGAFVPQSLKILRQRDAGAVSLRMYLLLVSASSLWIWFGVVIASVPVIATNSICLVLQACTLGRKLASLLGVMARSARRNSAAQGPAQDEHLP
jgi:MtN3 and saliva related transmembrane protein